MKLVQADVGNMGVQPEDIFPPDVAIGHLESAAFVGSIVNVLQFVAELFAVIKKEKV